MFVSSYLSSTATAAATPSAIRADQRRTAAARMMLWHPPVSTGHSFSPMSRAHSLFQRSARGLYRPLPGMVSSSRTIQHEKPPYPLRAN